MIAGGDDEHLRVWFLKWSGVNYDPACRIPVGHPISCVALDADLIVVGTKDGHICLYRIQNGQGEVKLWKRLDLLSEPIHKVRVEETCIVACSVKDVLTVSSKSSVLNRVTPLEYHKEFGNVVDARYMKGSLYIVGHDEQTREAQGIYMSDKHVKHWVHRKCSAVLDIGNDVDHWVHRKCWAVLDIGNDGNVLCIGEEPPEVVVLEGKCGQVLLSEICGNLENNYDGFGCFLQKNRFLYVGCKYPELNVMSWERKWEKKKGKKKCRTQTRVQGWQEANDPADGGEGHVPFNHVSSASTGFALSWRQNIADAKVDSILLFRYTSSEANRFHQPDRYNDYFRVWAPPTPLRDLLRCTFKVKRGLSVLEKQFDEWETQLLILSRL